MLPQIIVDYLIDQNIIFFIAFNNTFNSNNLKTVKIYIS